MGGGFAITEGSGSIGIADVQEVNEDQDANEGHDEYQNFTDQLINYQQENPNNFEMSNGYFRLTGMLNSSQQENLNLSQLLETQNMEAQA